MGFALTCASHSSLWSTLERELMHKSTFPNTFTFKIEPDEQGGATKTVTIYRRNIEPQVSGKKKKSSQAHLLIGFDTEYQAIKDREEEGTIEQGAKNELLSYQFSIKLFKKDSSADHPEAEGIIIPESDQRLTMQEFVGIAIGSLIEKYPDIVLPKSIYLLGHFLRADLPAFSDFKNTAQSMLNNVRSTFVSIDSAIPITFEENGEEIAEFGVSVRDTILLAPANAKSLADIGKMLGFAKISLGASPAEDLEIKQNMAKFRADRWPEFREYGIRDAQIPVRYAESVIKQSEELFNSFKMATTLTSFGTKILLKGWKDRDEDPLALLGRENIKERVFSKKKGCFFTKTSNPLMEEVYFDESFITESYHGGRNEQFLFGVADEGQWRDHDLSSAYTTAMSLIGKADWRNIQRLNSFDDVQLTDLSFFSVDFEFPEYVRFPTLPVRTMSGIIFPRRGNSKCAAPELVLAKRLGATLSFRRGVKVPTDPEDRIFRDFIRTCITNRKANENGSFPNRFWKEVGNSTYGKTAQGLREKRVYNLKADDMENLPESKITQPYFASFITSYTRAVLGEILNGFSNAVQVFSVTTDGFLSNADDFEITKATAGPLFRSFAEARGHFGDSEPLEVKHVVRRPIGWRTRGSATLMPGSEENGIVLQKGGLKTQSYDDDVKENSEVVNLFLHRKPDDKMTYKTGIGIKDMVRNDTDFVFRSVTKRLSMEFDWKRIPINEREVEFEFEGQKFSHLTFETKPIETVTDFDRLRETWENYNKKSFHNLKTLRDYRDFQTYQVTKSIVGERVSKYLRRENGDLQRLKTDLCRAFRRSQAGFDVELGKRRITHGTFKNALNSCGIPCEVTDVENARKKEFQPHFTPGTERVKAALWKLKEEHFQELEVDLFIAEADMAKNEKTTSMARYQKPLPPVFSFSPIPPSSSDVDIWKSVTVNLPTPI